jgi:aspartyl protease family protein
MLDQLKYVLVIGAAAVVVAPKIPAYLAEFKAQQAAPVKAASAVVPAPRAAGGGGLGVVELPAGPGGHYFADVEIEGARLRMLVDTGATVIALSGDDADKLGLRPAPSDFNVPVSTANGVNNAARARLREVRIGSINVAGVEALIMPRAAGTQSLLGMSFLKRLSSFNVDSQRLVLRQ